MTLHYLPPSKIIREPALEEELGIADLDIVAYTTGHKLTVVGQISAPNLTARFKMALIAYDQAGNIILTEENNTPYGSGLVTSEIVTPAFFNHYPFGFSRSDPDAAKIDHVKIYPIGETR